MLINEMETQSKEYNYVTNNIESWYYHGKNKAINVVAAPYSSLKPFMYLTKDLCEQGKKILYINSNGKACNDLIALMKNKYGSPTYSIIRDKFIISNGNFELVDCDKANMLEEEYDLVIYDDLSFYSSMSKIEIRNSLYYIYKKTKKLMIYSVEPIFDNVEVFNVPDLENYNPFVEPRILTTRIDLNEDIPYLLYEYLSWFKRNNRKVVIYTPNEEKTQLVYNYYSEKLRVSDRIKLIKLCDEKELNLVKTTMTMKDIPIMVITNLSSECFNDVKNMDAILYFADDKSFNYKNIIYICGRVTKGGEKAGEVLLVSNEVSDQMEIAKDMARNFNKIAWDRGLLK